MSKLYKNTKQKIQIIYSGIIFGFLGLPSISYAWSPCDPVLDGQSVNEIFQNLFDILIYVALVVGWLSLFVAIFIFIFSLFRVFTLHISIGQYIKQIIVGVLIFLLLIVGGQIAGLSDDKKATDWFECFGGEEKVREEITKSGEEFKRNNDDLLADNFLYPHESTVHAVDIPFFKNVKWKLKDFQYKTFKRIPVFSHSEKDLFRMGWALGQTAEFELAYLVSEKKDKFLIESVYTDQKVDQVKIDRLIIQFKELLQERSVDTVVLAHNHPQKLNLVEFGTEYFNPPSIPDMTTFYYISHIAGKKQKKAEMWVMDPKGVYFISNDRINPIIDPHDSDLELSQGTNSFIEGCVAHEIETKTHMSAECRRVYDSLSKKYTDLLAEFGNRCMIQDCSIDELRANILSGIRSTFRVNVKFYTYEELLGEEY